MDLDGVLIDSIKNMQLSWEGTSIKFNIKYKFEKYKKLVGLPFYNILKKFNLDSKKYLKIKKVTLYHAMHMLCYIPKGIHLLSSNQQRRSNHDKYKPPGNLIHTTCYPQNPSVLVHVITSNWTHVCSQCYLLLIFF